MTNLWLHRFVFPIDWIDRDMSGKNLFTIHLDYLIAPKQVLKNQAEHISQLSDGTIHARVETARGSQGMDDCFTHTFHIRVPKLAYTAQLFEVTHGIDMYPVQVRDVDWTYEKECIDAQSFEAAVAEILNSAATKRRLEALRSQAFAEMDEPPPIEFDYASSATVADQTPDEVESPIDEPLDHAEVETLDDDDSGSAISMEVEEESVETNESEVDYFDEWGEPVELTERSLAGCPDQFGAAIIYSNDGSPLFIVCAKNIRAALERQLGSKASPVVAKAKKSGLLFIAGAARSIDDAEQIVESRINTMPFRALLSDSETSDWL